MWILPADTKAILPSNTPSDGVVSAGVDGVSSVASSVCGCVSVVVGCSDGNGAREEAQAERTRTNNVVARQSRYFLNISHLLNSHT